MTTSEEVNIMEQGLSGRVVIVTGAAKGVGRAIAEEIVRQGGRVVLVVRSSTAVEPLAHALGKAAVTIIRDVNDPEAAAEAVAAGLDRWNRVDGLVNNAGTIDPIGSIGDTDPAVWQQAVLTNLVAPYRFMRAFIAARPSGGPRRIVNLSSGAAHKPMVGWSAYCASKAGVAMLTRSAQTEYGGDGILAFELIPGLIDTDMQERIRSSGVNEISRLPRTALMQAAEPARAAAFLLSGDGDDLAGGAVDIRDAAFQARLPAR
jgi:NAD(P)-dependent dehydrogenase (short-subunit alcohol dehydrogenase family)